MIDISAPIIPSESIANIKIGSNINSILDQVKIDDYRIEKKTLNENYSQYTINDGIVEVLTNLQGEVCRLSCSNGYKGKWVNRSIIGITISDLIEISDVQMVLHGFIIVDGIYGLAFSVPNSFEEVDTIEELPSDLIINKVHVMPEDWWR